MESVVTPLSEPVQKGPPLRCARCGIESGELTCFVITGGDGRPLAAFHCIACERERSSGESGLVAAVALLFPLTTLMLAAERAYTTPGGWMVVVALLMYPVVVLAHELGHATAAYLLGLEIGAIGIGHGRILWRGALRGVALNWHVWPVSGRVYLGSATPTSAGFRPRLWLATLAGPLTNLVLLGVALATWHGLEPLVGAPLLWAWVFSNALVGLSTLIPRRSTDLGRPVRSDGLALLQIPRFAAEDLEIYRNAVYVVRFLYRFDAGDYEAARVAAQEATARTPDKVGPRVLLCGCHVMLGQYSEALAAVVPILSAVQSEPPPVRAAIHNNMALALMLSNIAAAADDANLREALRLSAFSFGMYPCELGYRSTRALVLTASQQPEQALALLAYKHYETATPRQRGHRELARAFALTKLGKLVEARIAVSLAMRFDPSQIALARTLGLMTTHEDNSRLEAA